MKTNIRDLPVSQNMKKEMFSSRQYLVHKVAICVIILFKVIKIVFANTCFLLCKRHYIKSATTHTHSNYKES